jgi:hypothetical protein
MKFISKYSPNKQITPAQYIIELICERKASLNNIDLPIKFWNLPEWANFFRSQLRLCHNLLKQYSASAIVKALRDRRCSNIYSLGAPWLKPVIEEYEKIERLKQSQPKQYTGTPQNINLSSRRKLPKIKAGLINRLEEIDNG